MEPDSHDNSVQHSFGQDTPIPIIHGDSGFGEWRMIWLWTWFGTALAGGLFGVISAIYITIYHDTIGFGVLGVMLGGLVGTISAGFIGVLVIPSLAVIMWSVFLQRYPILLAAVAGALTGGLCVRFSWIWWLTGPIGALGAGLCVLKYLYSPGGKLFKIWQDRNRQLPLQFSIVDMFKRTTAIAVLICVWMFLIKRILFNIF
jgi:hypothetical protein